MAGRRDLIQGYQFAARRVVSAVVARETDPAEWPLRRLGGAGFGTIMLTVVVLAGFGIYGLIFPGGKVSWKDGRSVIVERETGARYVYLGQRLHPALNFASAALLVGSSAVISTAHRSLAGVRRGVELGIPGAPDAVPGTKDLVDPPWSICSEQVRDSTGRLVTRTALAVSRAPVLGNRTAERALLLTNTTSNAWYLVWHDHKYRITDTSVVGAALGLDQQVNVPVGAAWLDTLPDGLSIGPLEVPGAGTQSKAVPGVTTGQVLVVDSSTYYLAQTDRLVSLTELQARVQLAAPRTGRAVAVEASAVSAAKVVPAAPASDVQPPFSRPEFVRPATAEVTLCASFSDGSFAPAVYVDSRVPAGGGTPTTRVTKDGTALADRVWVPPGKAALVRALPSPTATDGPVYLITDTGKRYAVPTPDALRALGFSAASRVGRLPAGVLVRIPEGPPLDPVAARAALANEPTN